MFRASERIYSKCIDVCSCRGIEDYRPALYARDIGCNVECDAQIDK